MRSITYGRPPKGFLAKALEKSVIATLVRIIGTLCSCTHSQVEVHERKWKG
jgi:hypothetical protein